MFTPILPISGLAGYRFLQRTLDKQQTAFNNSAELARDVQYFRDNIAKADTAEKLVADRRLLRVALGAFGLGDEINKQAFVRKALTDGTEERTALANKLVDPKYREFSAAFGFGNSSGAQVAAPGFAEDVISRYRVRAFEEAVGAVDTTMRLAMNFDRAIQPLAAKTIDPKTIVFQVLGDTALRTVIESALGLPDSFASIDVDKQAEVVTDKLKRLVGSDGIKALTDPAKRDTVLRTFFVREQIKQGPSASTPGFSALTLLQNGSGAGPSAILNLLLSRL